MTWLQGLGLTCAIFGIAFVGVPVVVYLCAKFGTFGVLKARDQFNKQQKESENGEQSRT